MNSLAKQNQENLNTTDGSADVTRLYADPRTGAVSILVKSLKSEVQVYVTRTGKIRIWKDGAELNEQKGEKGKGTQKKKDG